MARTKGNIPSQQPRKTRGYDPRRQPDIDQLPPLQQRYPEANIGGPKGNNASWLNQYLNNSVQSVWNSRPVNAQDFLFARPVAPIRNPGNRSFELTVEVPENRIYYVTAWTLGLIFETANAANPITNPNGTSNVIVNLDFLRDGVGVQDYSEIPYNIFPFGTVSQNSFFVISSGSRFTFQGTLDATVSNDITIVDGQLELLGTSLLSSGRDTNFEQASQYPIPVRLVEE